MTNSAAQSKVIESSYPFPFRCARPAVKVVYIDLDHLHMHERDEDKKRAVFRDLAGP